MGGRKERKRARVKLLGDLSLGVDVFFFFDSLFWGKDDPKDEFLKGMA